MRIEPAVTPEQIAAARVLFQEYAAGLNIDLGFQGFDAELAGLPGKYAPPQGALLVAFDPATATYAGCVALRPLGPSAESTCEMKRLYVRPTHRGAGLGRQLAEAIVAEGTRLGYRRMRLDSLRSLTAALRLYSALGFYEIAAYYDNPVPGVVYWEKVLA